MSLRRRCFSARNNLLETGDYFATCVHNDIESNWSNYETMIQEIFSRDLTPQRVKSCSLRINIAIIGIMPIEAIELPQTG